MNRICLSHSFNPRWALSKTVSWATTTPTGPKWYWTGALLRQRDCSVLHWGSGLTAQNVIRRRKKIRALFSFIKTVCSLQKSPEFQFCFVFSFVEYILHCFSLGMILYDSQPPFLLSLEALAPLAGLSHCAPWQSSVSDSSACPLASQADARTRSRVERGKQEAWSCKLTSP